MHLGKVLLVTSTLALYLSSGDAAGRVARLISSRKTASAGQGELWSNILAILETRGATACGSAVNAMLQDLAHTYTEAHVGDVLSHVCYDGTFFHAFPTKEVCLRFTESVVEEFNGKQDYVPWCKEFKAVIRSNSTNATAEPTMPASNTSDASDASNASNTINASNASSATNFSKVAKWKRKTGRKTVMGWDECMRRHSREVCESWSDCMQQHGYKENCDYFCQMDNCPSYTKKELWKDSGYYVSETHSTHTVEIGSP